MESFVLSYTIIIFNRIIKFIGSLVKAFGYMFHFFFPKKRFEIPIDSKPLIKSKQELKIPKIIWQTNYTNLVTLPVYVNYLFNRLISPDFAYRYVSTEERDQIIKELGTEEEYDAFSKLTDGAAQADFWRLFTLNQFGGVYMDIDAHAVWPISKMIEPEDTELFLLNKQHYTNYFMASSKDNKILKKALNIIVNNIQEKNIGSGVYDLTGPTVLNLAIADQSVNHRFYRITCNQGSFTNEYFQYIDKPQGKWTHSKKENLLKD